MNFVVEASDVHGAYPEKRFPTCDEAKRYVYSELWTLCVDIAIRAPDGGIVHQTDGVEVRWWHLRNEKGIGTPFPEN